MRKLKYNERLFQKAVTSKLDYFKLRCLLVLHAANKLTNI